MTSTSATARAHVLVVEDEQDLRDLMRFNLEREGLRITCAATGEEALNMARADRPDLVLLDLMLPSMDGLGVCRALRQDAVLAKTPIVMVTAKGEEADVVVGLEMGADDYIAKPFSPRILLARVKAVLRRRQAPASAGDELVDGAIRIDNMTIDPERHEVVVDEESISLTATEFRLLSLLASRPGRVFTREQIINKIHGSHVVVTERSVDVQVAALRKKLGGEARRRIESVRGVGYRFRE